MKIDLPQCDFSDCRRRINGNCNSKEAFRNCPYQRMRMSEDVTLLSCSENGNSTYHLVFNVRAPDGYSMTINAPFCTLY